MYTIKSQVTLESDTKTVISNTERLGRNLQLMIRIYNFVQLYIKETATGKFGLLCFIRPFFLAYYPDRLASGSTLTTEANLDAIQTLNELIDTVDELYDREADTKYSAVNEGRVELKLK